MGGVARSDAYDYSKELQEDLEREVCGTGPSATFDRAAFGIDFAKAYGFKMKTTLHIQAEGVRQQAA